MNIAWYTPFANNSTIGRFSSVAVAALRDRGATIQIVRSESKSPALLETPPADPAETYVWAADLSSNLSRHLRQYDLVVYNVGDRYDDHLHCFQHQPLAAGMTILHDGCLHHALHNHCRRTLRAASQYRILLDAECGADAAKVYDRMLEAGSQQQWWHEEIARFPVFRWALQDTLGVVTHAEHFRETLVKRIGCPTAMIPLACRIPTPVATPTPCHDQRKLTIVTTGAVNVNKRHQSIIRALASSPLLLERFRFRIAGTVAPEQQRIIDSAVMSCARKPEVSVTGQSSCDVVEREIAAADVVASLHHPAMEGSTASVTEGLLSGKPLIVSRTAFSSNVPDSLALKVSPGHEHHQIVDFLSQIANDYPSAIARADAARRWAQPRHAPEAYAERFLEFAERVLYNRPVLQVADRIAGCLQTWNSHIDPKLLQRLDSAMHDLFGKSDERRRAA